MRKPEQFLQSQQSQGTYQHTLQLFLRNREKRNSPHTIERLYYNLHPLGHALGNPPAANITRQQLHQYQRDLWRTYAPETIRTVTADIRQFFRWSKKKNLVPANPAKHLQPVATGHAPRRRNGAAPEADVTAVLHHLSASLSHLIYRDIFGNLQHAETGWLDNDRHALRDLFLLLFLYETGARAGEAANLSSQAMNHSQRYGRVHTVTVTGKTANRNRHYTTATAELWHIWQQIRPSGGEGYAIVGWRPGQEAAPLTANGISQIVLRRSRAAGVRPFRANALRHAKIKRTRQSFSLEVTSRLMDHSSLSSTLNYANIEAEEIAHAATITGLQTDLWNRPK